MTIFDQEADAQADADADLTKEFWGERAGWTGAGSGRNTAFQISSSDEPTGAFHLDRTPASMKAIRDGIAAFRPKRRRRGDSTGPIERTREHRVAGAATDGSTTARAADPRAPRRPSPDRLAHRDATIADLAAGRYDGAPYPRPRPADHGDVADVVLEHDDELVALTPIGSGPRPLGSVDPVIIRVALVVIAIVLAIPLALALRDDSRPSGTETDPGTPVVGPARGAEGVVAIPQTATAADGVTSDPASGSGPATADAADSTGEPAATPAPPEPAVSGADDRVAPTPGDSNEVARLTESYSESATSAPAAPATSTVAATDATTVESDAVATAATVTQVAVRDMPDCSHSYTAGPGDSWYRIAGEAGVTPAALLEQNRATLDTVIFPDAEICLPAGAAMPSPPTTAAATTVPTTDAPTTAAPTTAAPTTTPTTTAAPQPSYTRHDVQALIREIWPDELEEKALEIAHRESNYDAAADNGWCCVGVFQLYWTVHRSWLDDHGILTRDDLKDARKNINAAYALYQRSGGWGPWGG